jgi:phosphoribosylformylglycinamidine synthase
VAEACRAFGTPVTGGNVSLYNESPTGVVDPTPTVGMVGLIDEEKHITTQWFKDEDDVIILVGTAAEGVNPDPKEMTSSPTAELTASGHDLLGGSRYLKVCHGLKVGPPPHIDLAHEIKVQNAVRQLIHTGLVKSAHDCSEGGLAVALAECCFNPERLFGANIDCSRRPLGDVEYGKNAIDASHSEAATVLFNESQSRIVISVAPKDLDKTLGMLREHGVAFQQLGTVGGGDELRIRIGEQPFRWRVADIHDDWWNAIRRAVEQEESIPSL